MPRLCPLRDGQTRNVLPVIEDLPLRGLHQPHDDLGQRGLAAAVGAGKHHQLVIRNNEVDVVEYVHRTLRQVHPIADVLQL